MHSSFLIVLQGLPDDWHDQFPALFTPQQAQLLSLHPALMAMHNNACKGKSS
jgi:hypothetical protein